MVAAQAKQTTPPNVSFTAAVLLQFNLSGNSLQYDCE
jgi:hypothetical protein